MYWYNYQSILVICNFIGNKVLRAKPIQQMVKYVLILKYKWDKNYCDLLKKKNVISANSSTIYYYTKWPI